MDLGKKRLFLLDLDGTVYLEETLLPGAAAFFRWAAESGAHVRYLTNNSSRGVEAGLEKMHRLGVPARREEFLTAVEAAIYYLRTRRKAGEAYYVVGTESFCSQLRQAGIDVRRTPDADVAAVLVGFDTELCYQRWRTPAAFCSGARTSWPRTRTWPAPRSTASCRTAVPSAA